MPLVVRIDPSGSESWDRIPDIWIAVRPISLSLNRSKVRFRIWLIWKEELAYVYVWSIVLKPSRPLV